MKKVITLILAFSLMVCTYAQDTLKHADISVQITAPDNNAAVAYGDTVYISYSYTNNGPDMLPAGDTVFFLTPLGVYYSALIQDFGVGQTFVYNDAFSIHNPFDSAFSLDFCIAQIKQSDVIYEDSSAPATTYIDTNASNDTSCITITLNGPAPSGILNTNATDNMLSLYPNPANDWLYIDAPEKFEGCITDVTGKVTQNISSGNMQASGNKYKIDVSRLSPGIYFIRIQTKNKLSVGKFIKAD